MIELTTFLILNFLGAFFTIFILAFKTIPEETDESSGWKGMAFVSAIISAIIWLVCMVAVLDIGVIQPYAFISGSTVVTGSVTVHYPDTWPFMFVYVLATIIPFVLLLFLWPESWKNIGKRE
jgi:hypothetical protein